MSAALPSLGRLSLQQPARVVATGVRPIKEPARATTGTGLHDLPPELLGLIFKAIDADDPCATLEGLCNANALWGGWCRDGWIYDVANSALGYYGPFTEWMQVRKFYFGFDHKQAARERANPDRVVIPKGAATPKAYFQQACRARFRLQTSEPVNLLMGVERHHPFYGARLLLQMPSLDLYAGFKYVPDNLWNYSAIAKLAVEHDESALDHVRKDRDDYGAIAKLAVQSHGEALQWVAVDRDDYGAIAMAAVQNYGNALQWVAVDRDDYNAIAMAAVQNDVHALSWVPTDRDDFGEIAKMAVQSHHKITIRS